MGLLDFRITKNYVKLFFEHLQYGEDEKAIRMFHDKEVVRTYPYSLHYACYFYRVELVKEILLHRRKLVHQLDEYDQNPLHYAVNHFNFSGHTLGGFFKKQMLPKQITRGMTPNYYHLMHRKEKDSNLIRKIYLKPLFEIIDLLVDAGVNLEQANINDEDFSCTPLFMSIAARDEHTAKYLIEKYSAKVDLVDNFEVKGFGKKNFTIMSLFNVAYRLPWGCTDISVYMQKKITNNFKKYLLDKNAPNKDVFDMEPDAYE